MRVTGVQWQTEFDVEVQSTAETDNWWDKEPPLTVKTDNCHREYRRDDCYETCAVYDSKANCMSYIEHCTPIYENYCHFTYHVWTKIDEAKAYGIDCDDIAYPEPPKTYRKQPGYRLQSYEIFTVTLEGKNTEYNIHPSGQTDFCKVRVGESWATDRWTGSDTPALVNREH